MQVTPAATPGAAPTPFPQQTPDAGDASRPQPALTANPYSMPDQVVQSGAASAADRFPGDLYAAVQNLYNAAIGDDLHVLGDPSQSVGNRLLHAGSAALTVLTLPGGPESLGLKLAAKETVKGGLEQVTYHALASAGGKTGKLILQGGVKLTPGEEQVAAEFAGRGQEVIARPPASVGKSADFLIDGKPTELKTISNVKTQNASTAVTKTIKEATKQAKNVVIDARNQRGLTEADARRAVQRAFDALPKTAITRVDFLGRDVKSSFEFTVTRK